MPAVLLIGTMCAGAVVLAGAKTRCVDAAYGAARAAARGEPAGVVRQAAADAGPRDAEVTVVRTGDTIEVTVTATVAAVPLLPGFRLTAHTVAAAEPGSVGDPDG